MSITELIEKLKRENRAFAKEYERIDLAFEVSEMVFEARCSAGLSQTVLAKKVGTKQSSIARIESGASLPSLSFLEKIAKALKLELVSPQFKKSAIESAGERIDTSTVSVEASVPSEYFTLNDFMAYKTDSSDASHDIRV